MPGRSPSPADAPAILARHGESVTAYLRSLLARYADAPPRLMEAVEYSLMAGGKRLRPALVLETARACGGETAGDRAAPKKSALAAAGAIELIHTFSLVHDDLPAMDDDDLRRGRPTSHKVFGEAMAILAGDAMVATAFEAIAADAEPAVAPALAAELASATGPRGMIGGQVLDMAASGANEPVTLPQLQALHRMKTGALLVASCRMGAIAAGAKAQVLEAVTRYGRHMGLAFQIVDDLLDVTSTPEQLGKATRKDAAKGKTTYPGLIGIDGSREEARRQLAAALDALSGVGPAAGGLRQLAEFVVRRQV
jgi:geranylgeranyl diphosphate synthase type II